MAGKQPYISVVIPTYNRADYLRAAVDSVLDQKGFNGQTEIIVVDDGSTDGTEKIIKELGSKIRYYKLHHSGLPAVPRNFGIAKARGELIAFQDSDDLWAPEKFMDQVPMFNDNNVVLSYGNAEIMDKNAKHTGKLVVEPDHLNNGGDFNYLINENVVSTLTVIARKSAINKAGGFNESVGLNSVEDYHLWLRLSLIGDFAHTDKVIAYYRKHDKNISPTSQLESVNRLINLNKLLLRELPAQKEIIRNRLAKLYDDHSRLVRFPYNRLSGMASRRYARPV